MRKPRGIAGVAAPGFAVRPRALRAGLRGLRALGFEPRVGRHALDRAGYLAGDDADRADDVARLWLDPEVDVLWFARGGYGTARLLDALPWRRLDANDTPLVGYSDLTALFNAALRRSGRVCLYGPVVTELGDPPAWHRPSLESALARRPFALRFRRRDLLAPAASGKATGRLIGGNLAVYTHLCGTRWAPDPRGAVLFLEEVGEPVYRIDRMLTHLRQAGALRGLAGVLLGGMAAPARRRFPPDRELDEVLREAFEPLGVPVVRDVPAGHVAGKWTLPLGAPAEIDVAARTVTFRP